MFGDLAKRSMAELIRAQEEPHGSAYMVSDFRERQKGRDSPRRGRRRKLGHFKAACRLGPVVNATKNGDPDNQGVNLSTVGELPNIGSIWVVLQGYNCRKSDRQMNKIKELPEQVAIPHMECVKGRWQKTRPSVHNLSGRPIFLENRPKTDQF